MRERFVLERDTRQHLTSRAEELTRRANDLERSVTKLVRWVEPDGFAMPDSLVLPVVSKLGVPVSQRVTELEGVVTELEARLAELTGASRTKALSMLAGAVAILAGPESLTVESLAHRRLAAWNHAEALEVLEGSGGLPLGAGTADPDALVRAELTPRDPVLRREAQRRLTRDVLVPLPDPATQARWEELADDLCRAEVLVRAGHASVGAASRGLGVSLALVEDEVLHQALIVADGVSRVPLVCLSSGDWPRDADVALLEGVDEDVVETALVLAAQGGTLTHALDCAAALER